MLPKTDSMANETQKQLGRKARSRFTAEYEVMLTLLKKRTEESGLTQEEIAAAIGKTQSHVSMCLNREREISIVDLLRWCKPLGITLREFVGELEDELGKSKNEKSVPAL